MFPIRFANLGSNLCVNLCHNWENTVSTEVRLENTWLAWVRQWDVSD